MSTSLINTLFYEEPAGTFAHGHIFKSAPDLGSARQDPGNGYWHCNLADHDALTWSAEVYELFGLPAGAPVTRDMALARYDQHSRMALDSVRKYALLRDFGFILDAGISAGSAYDRRIRVLAVPILGDGRVVGLHGVKRGLYLV